MKENYHYFCESPLSPYTNKTAGLNFVPACDYPFLNKGFNDDALWEEGDCSIRFSDATPNYGVVTAIYVSVALFGLAFAISNFYKSYKRRPAGSAFPSRSETNQMIMVFYATMNLLVCVDPEKRSGFLTHPNNLAYNLISGTMLTACYYMLARLVCSWAGVINGGFSKTVTIPTWLKAMSYFTIVLGFVGEVVVAELQWRVGTISKTSDVKIADVPGMSNPTVNASKNGLIGVVLLIWLFITQYYGHQLRKLLKGGGGAAAEKKILQYLTGLSFCLLMAVAYKFLFSAIRLSRGGVASLLKAPCSTPYASILCIIYNMVNYIACYVMRPGSIGSNSSKVGPGSRSKVTTAMSTQSTAS
ncbi:hypothetical protein TrST_g8665 [Triparma strigata]|uniref:Uncharacterized protein n=1 Tax=Triparma strigata TaxID=1606541 RepID=A0A9W7AZQ9_9STRA|nr:hypothetical protein TrST_g8665 [Triparma strigata]